MLMKGRSRGRREIGRGGGGARTDELEEEVVFLGNVEVDKLDVAALGEVRC